MTPETRYMLRALEVVRAAGLASDNPQPGWRWRVSADLFAAIEHVMHPSMPRLIAYPLEVDESLPPNSMILERTRP
jgi:hypothetical protein